MLASLCPLVWVAWLTWLAPLALQAQTSDAASNLPPNGQPHADAGLYPLEERWRELSVPARRTIDKAVLTAYSQISKVGSSDLVLIDDRARETFLSSARQAIETELPESDESEIDASVFVWRLLSLRKAGKLPTSMGRAQPPALAEQDRLIAEIASRRAEDQFQRSLDRILVDDAGRVFFASAVQQIDADADLKQIRRAALALRKTRQLRPELSSRLVDWPIDQRSHRYSELAADLHLIPDQPGIYLFRDSTGYLYIGEAKSLRQRLTTHFTDSDRKTLFDYLQHQDQGPVFIDLHVFPAESPGATLSVRRAYESELIRSRNPKFNLRP
jgi:hypothetical protein